MATFSRAYQIGRVNEGGYSNRKADLGGETYCGVSRVYNPSWKGWPIIDVIKKHRKIAHGEIIDNAQLEGHLFNFYKESFWDKLYGDEILDQQVANIFYDWTLTSGGAVKQVQKVIGATADGKWGPRSLGKLNADITLEGGQKVFEEIKMARHDYYISLNQPENERGWLNRVASFMYKCDQKSNKGEGLA